MSGMETAWAGLGVRMSLALGALFERHLDAPGRLWDALFNPYYGFWTTTLLAHATNRGAYDVDARAFQDALHRAPRALLAWLHNDMQFAGDASALDRALIVALFLEVSLSRWDRLVDSACRRAVEADDADAAVWWDERGVFLRHDYAGPAAFARGAWKESLSAFTETIEWLSDDCAA